jgi:hypothetical protein
VRFSRARRYQVRLHRQAQRIWQISLFCDVLEVSRSGFNAWLNHPASLPEIHDARLVTVIETSFEASERVYSARRVWRDGNRPA